MPAGASMALRDFSAARQTLRFVGLIVYRVILIAHVDIGFLDLYVIDAGNKQ